LQAASWRITGGDAASVRKQLQEQLAQSGAMVADLIKLFDDDNNGELLIDDMEFHKAMKKRFGWRGMPWVLDEVFRSIDSDGSGEIGFDELFEFVRGRRHALDRRTKCVRAMALQSDEAYALSELVWDSDELRRQINLMLERSHVSTADLLRAWDRSGDGRLSEVEFISSVADLFISAGHETLWDDEVHEVAVQVFATIVTSGDNQVRMSELEKWLVRGLRRAGGSGTPGRSGPLLKSDSTLLAAQKHAAMAAAKKVKAQEAARRRADEARRMAKSKVSSAIAIAASTARARAAASQRTELQSREAAAARRTFLEASPRPLVTSASVPSGVCRSAPITLSAERSRSGTPGSLPPPPFPKPLPQ